MSERHLRGGEGERVERTRMGDADGRRLALTLHLGVSGAILWVATVAFVLRECGFGPSFE